MALIIKGDMPKACWNMRNVDGKIIRYSCPYCGCCSHVFPYDVDYRPSDCPILGEMPDEYGRLIDADALEDLLDEVNGYGAASEITYKKMIEILHDETLVPTIVEATE